MRRAAALGGASVGTIRRRLREQGFQFRFEHAGIESAFAQHALAAIDNGQPEAAFRKRDAHQQSGGGIRSASRKFVATPIRQVFRCKHHIEADRLEYTDGIAEGIHGIGAPAVASEAFQCRSSIRSERANN